jgi:CHRD domain
MRSVLPVLGTVVALAACGGSDPDPDEGDTSAAPTTAVESTATATDDPDRGPLFVVELAGDAEVPGPGAAGASGRLELEISAELSTVCVNGEVDGTDEINRLHLHSGTADEPSEGGDVTIDLGAPPTDQTFPPFLLNYCVNADGAELEDLLAELDEDPGDYFVHVVTDEYPEGAARGPLSAS